MDKLTEATTFTKLISRFTVDKRIIINPIERIEMNNNKTNDFLAQLFDIIDSLKKIFSDGFQWTDTFQLTGLLPKFVSMLMKLNEVKTELPQLSKEQIKDLTRQYSEIGLKIFWVNNNSEDEKYGITNIETLLKELTDIVEAGIAALKDGINVADLQYLPEVITSTISIINVSSDAFEEVKHLSAVKVSALLVSMLSKIFYVIK